MYGHGHDDMGGMGGMGFGRGGKCACRQCRGKHTMMFYLIVMLLLVIIALMMKQQKMW